MKPWRLPNFLLKRMFWKSAAQGSEISFRDDDSDLHQAGLLHKRSDEHVHINIKGRIQRIPRKAVTCVRLTNPTG